MSRTRKRDRIPVPSERDLGPAYFRLCHFCFHLNEAPIEVARCSSCQRALKFETLAQEYEADEAMIEDLDENFFRLSREDRSGFLDDAADGLMGSFEVPPPLQGLEVLW